MNNLLGFERIINRCPVVDCMDYSQYPLASDEELIQMEKASCRSNSNYVFVFVRAGENAAPYIEVYVWDAQLYERDYIRFIICEGMCLTEDLEGELIGYTKFKRLQIPLTVMQKFNADVISFFPQWNFREYEVCDIGEALEHIYYASHNSGPKEVLYKAGLSNIAYNLHEFESYNAIGTTPGEIIGHDIPMRLLRIMNQPNLTPYFYDEESIIHSIKVYSCFSEYIGNRYLSLGQWTYLEALFTQRKLDKGDFSYKIFNNLSFLNKSREECWSIIDFMFSFLDVLEQLGMNIQEL